MIYNIGLFSIIQHCLDLLSEYISVEGHMPSSDDPDWTKVFVFAPMCRYAEDLPLLYKSSVSDKEKLKNLRLDESVSRHNVSLMKYQNNHKRAVT